MVAFSKGLDGFFHSLVPTRLRENLVANSAEYIRARALVVVLLISTIVPTIATLVIGGHHLLFNPDLLKHDIVSLAIALLFGTQTAFFYRFGNQWLSSTAFTNTYFILIALLLIMSGGIHSPMKAILLTCPIVSFLVGGKQEGLQSALIIILFMSGLATLSAIEFELPDLFREESPQMIFAVNWVGTVTIIAVCIMVYESELQNRNAQTNTQQNLMRKRISSLNDSFDAYIHGLVPKSLREILDVTSGAYVRVRTLSVMLFFGAAISIISTIILVSVHLLSYKYQLKYDFVLAAIALLFGIQTWLFYRFNNFWFSGLVLSYFYFILILLLVIFGGGYDAPTMVLLLISPIIFFMLGGLQQGIQNSVFVMMAGIFFSSMKYIGFNFSNVFDAIPRTMTYTIVFVISVVIIALCIIVYDTKLQERG